MFLTGILVSLSFPKNTSYYLIRILPIIIYLIVGLMSEGQFRICIFAQLYYCKDTE